MKKSLGLWSVASGLIASTAFAGTPVLQAGSSIYAGSAPLAVELGYSMPFVVDWNNDGKKDLLVGQKSGGKVRLYLNEGTDANPSFNGFSYLQAGGSDISLPGG